jgi:hypothetical protein
MKKTFLLMTAFITLLCIAPGCKGGKKTAQAAAEEPAVEVETFMTAIENYLTDIIAPDYSQGTYCIPFCDWVCADESNPDTIAVLGNFWVMNYDQEGDTLKTVSGGNHSGKMIVLKDAAGHFSVAGFEQTEDGSGYEASARRIFGGKYDDYAAAHSDEVAREKVRAQSIAAFVKRDSLEVKYYQDFGWPAVEIPAE